MIVLAMTSIPALAATDYPTKQISYLICFDPGGQSDREARRQQPHLERILKQKVLIDYKVGGGGALGWRELTRSKSDGYFIGGFNIRTSSCSRYSRRWATRPSKSFRWRSFSGRPWP